MLATGFVLGIGVTSVVYWLIMVPNSSDQGVEVIAPVPQSTSEQLAREHSEPADVSGSRQSPVAAISSLHDLANIDSAFERGLALWIFLADSNESQAARLLSQSQEISSYIVRNDIQRTIVKRLAQLNPKRAFSELRELGSQSHPGQFVSIIFQDWSRSNLDEAVAYAQTSSIDWKDTALRAILEERKDLSEQVLRSIARDLGNEQVVDEAITQRKFDDAIENPGIAWNELIADLQNDPQHRYNILQVASAWVEKSGLSVLDQISQSLTNLETRQHVIRQILFDVAYTNPRGALQYALTIQNDTHNSIITGVIRNWARTDPQSAFAAASEVEENSIRRALEKQVAQTWAHNEPREVLKGIGALPEHARESAIISALGTIAAESPKEAALLVARLENGSAKTNAATNVVRNWANQDHKAALDWILNEPGVEDIRSQILGPIMHTLVEVDPQLAMDTALSQPIAKGEGGQWRGMGIGLEFNVISSLAYADMDRAIEMLPKVREGITKTQAYSVVSGALIQNGEVDKALDIVQKAPESERTNLYGIVTTSWAANDPEGLLGSMDRLPSKEIKSQAALVLVSFSQFNQFDSGLSDEQIEQAKKFLTDEDAKSLEKREANMLEFFQGGN